MKRPVSPPAWGDLLQHQASQLDTLATGQFGPEVQGVYEHWDHLRHLTPPNGLDVKQWWFLVKWARMVQQRKLPLHGKQHRPFTLTLSDSIQRRLFLVARDAAGALRGQSQPQSEFDRERFLVRSLMEEAMTSSQLEGAATTIQVAKDMLKSGRQPRDYGERMIFNNYATMRELKRWRQRPLTPEAVFEIHRMLTDGTLESDKTGRFRKPDEDIVIEDETGRTLHVPPHASELPERLQALCDFANRSDEDEHFIHPVVRAILIHFQLAYDHPFCDGNGRTARTLFYWSMLRSGFWMAEYLSISHTLKQAPAQYMRSYLLTETDDGDVTYFVSHQLDALLKAIAGVHRYIARKQREHEDAQILLKPGNKLARQLNHRQRELLLNALRNPGKPYTIERHRRTHDVVYQTARTDLLDLVKAGLMQKHQQGKSYLFVAKPNLANKLGR